MRERTMPRNIPNEPADVALPAMYWDVSTSTLKPTQQLSIFNAAQTQPWHSQLGHLTVLDVVETNDPVTQDYP